MSAMASNVVHLHATAPAPDHITLQIPLAGGSLGEMFLRLQTAAELCCVIVSKTEAYGAQAVTAGVADVLRALQASILGL